ncbi:hypothetical protein V5O48_010190 [Marasmius crinis-equi]|uniref:CxC2-like cysteine cluster KDZ transposase-associated domain-containing protein n=1 Tax=Marasmius crinis-equi TaxID=585013 RepID=A0ABR3F965_9AGAR
MGKAEKHKKKKHNQMFSGDELKKKNSARHNIMNITRHRVHHSTFPANIEVNPEAESLDKGPSIPGGWTSDSEETVCEEVGEEPGKVKVKATCRRYLDSDAPLLTWGREHQDEYLDWNVITEGRGRLYLDSPGCAACSSPSANFRCRDCTGLYMVCLECLRRDHFDEPLHKIEEWKEDHFSPISLQALGLRYQVGHRRGHRCPFPQPAHKDFVVLSLNGIHTITLDFCGCKMGKDIAHHLQLMEMGWWPSSYKDPRSASTFELLRSFHITNLQCQTAPTDFYQALEQMTDGTGMDKPPGRDAQFLLMIRQWRHIKMMKRCGRGHDPSGVLGTTHGSATVPCRACPHPKKNLPPGWEKASAEDQFLYALFLAEDANFKQKARARPNDARDPPLGPGWGVFVPNDVYMEELGKRTDEQEISHCVGFNALAAANTKKHKGLRATGIGAVTCARHETFRPNGMGDLQVGERYSNMDFIALFNLIGCAFTLIFFSYDIACQWMSNFRQRMETYPEYMQIPSWTRLVFKVPKFHLVTHILKCLAPFSFTYTEGAAKTDGEGVERSWSWLNGSARSMSMMSLGGRWDTLDDFANFSNWRKTINLDTLLLKKMVKAIPESIINARLYVAFTEALEVQHAQELSTWQEQVMQWERGNTNFCPYNIVESKISLNEVKKQLAEEEHRREADGLNASSAITISAVVIEGLEIEEAQCALAVSAEAKTQTTFQQRSVQGRRTKLLARIRKYRECLLIHNPYLRRLIETESTTCLDRPEAMKLYLPSSLPELFRGMACSDSSIDIENRLRYAQAYDALHQLRQQLRARSVAYRNKSRLTVSQGVHTRMNTLQTSIESKIRAIKETYRRARAALLALRGDGRWTASLQELKDQDIRGFGERALKDKEKEDWIRAQELAGVDADAIDDVINGVNQNIPTMSFNRVLALGQGKEENALSWIWYTHRPMEGENSGSNDGDTFQEIQDSLRSEWCKARANARRPREELRLVEEEMRRAIEYCLYLEGWWKQQIGRREGVSDVLQEGLTAYATQHAFIERRRSLHWTESWAAIRERGKVILLHLSDPRYKATLPPMPELEIELNLDDDDDETIVAEDDEEQEQG